MIPFTDLSLIELAQAAGYAGIFLIVFLESGVPIGFFLPGDTLLFATGLLAAQGIFDIVPLILLIVIAAITGDSVGYWFGSHFGPKLFHKEDALFLSKKNIERTEAFYARYGKTAIILARFVPVVRTFVPIMAGVGSMQYRTFLTYNVIGALIWGAGVTLLGYGLGSVLPDPDRYLLPLVVIFAIISTIPIVTEWYRSQKKK